MKPAKPNLPVEELSPDPRTRLAGLLLALVTVLVYLPVCFHDYIAFDDPTYVSDNPMIQAGLKWAGLKWAFAGWHAGNWHPLTWLSLMLDCQLFGANPGAQHLVNALFHAANVVLIYVLLLRLVKKFWPAVMIAALFAFHPLHVESVAWIAERKDVLSTFFGLLAMLAYTRYAQAGAGLKNYLLSLVFFALSLLAKPMLVTLPFLLLLLDHWPLKRTFTFRTVVTEKTPFFLLTMASCVITFLAQREHAVISLQQTGLGLRVENALAAYLGYLAKAVCPVDLGVFYPLPEHAPWAAVCASLFVLAALSYLAWRLRQSHGHLLTGWLWFLGTLVPVIGLVQVGDQAMADRYFYVPSIGLFAMIVFCFLEWSPKSLRQPAAILALLACIAITEHQLAFWRDTITLFARTVAVTRDNGPAHMMLGVGYEQSGKPDAAIREYQEALRCNSSLIIQVAGGEHRPLAAQVQLLLGQAAEKSGASAEALAAYHEALRLDADLPEAHNNLGNLLDALGRADEALAEYRAAVQLRPDQPLVHENLGTQLAKMGRLDEAIVEYDTADRLAPADPHPLYLMGKAYLHAGRLTDAVAKFQAALQCDADDYQSLTWLARVLAAANDASVRNGAQAVNLAEKANTLTENAQPFILGTLAMAYAEVGRFPDAQSTAQKALQLTGTNELDASALKQQLQRYESSQPWREDFSAVR